VSRDTAVERVTGIEPAWPAWKAGDSAWCPCWPGAQPTALVPFSCL